MQLLLLLPLFFPLFLSPYLLFRFFTKPTTTTSSNLPKSHPIIGTYLSAKANKNRRNEWFTELVANSPRATFVIKHLSGLNQVVTGNPAVVQHILRTNFANYGKGDVSRAPATDFLGNGIFNTDGHVWKVQRQIASHEFSTRTLRRFVETVVSTELSSRLVPILSTAAESSSIVDFQDLLQRFAFDNICSIAFGFDLGYLLPSLPMPAFVKAFDDATMITGQRSQSLVPLIWKFKRFFKIGSEKKLAAAIAEVRGFASFIVGEKQKADAGDSNDLLSRFLGSGYSDERFVTDVVISFILAGRDTTSSALTWFFWLLSRHPEVEREVLREIHEVGAGKGSDAYDKVKEMVYMHAALCESMRLYPPVPVDSKLAVAADVLPDGTAVRKGDRVTYLPYAMGRLEAIWGKDWPEYRPERWLKRTDDGERWVFAGRDPYSYPVFQAGPRICLGKDMAFVQMKKVVAGVLQRFRLVPAMPVGTDPVFVSYLTSRMRDGFPVRIEPRAPTVSLNGID